MAVSSSPLKVVLLTTHRLVTEAIVNGLNTSGGVRVVGTTLEWPAAIDIMTEWDASIAVVSANLDNEGSFKFVRELRQTIPHARAIAIAESVHFAIARELIRLGAAGYVTYDDSLQDIAQGIRKVSSGGYAFRESLQRSIIETMDGLRLVADFQNPELSLLTARELDVFTCIVMGDTVKSAAERLSLSPSTVDNHKTRLMHKLGAHRSIDLFKIAIRERLVPW